MKFPSIKDVAHDLRITNAEDAGGVRAVDEGEYIDVRLQVYPDGQWAIRSGDSSYDLDHRGFWGASTVPGNKRRHNSRQTAKDLIDQCRNHYAESGDKR